MKTAIKQDKLLSNVINNLKNPTVAQIKALELFLSTSANKINTEEKDLIELTLNSCNYMHKMIDNYSLAVKLNSEKLYPDYKQFNIIELLEKTVKDINILLKYSNLNVNIYPDKNYFVKADEIKIRNVIESLLLYGINSSCKNSDIDIFISDNKNDLKFEVKIPCFDYKEDETSDYSDSNPKKQDIPTCNIGLFIAKEIIYAHFGKMIYKRKDNKLIIGFYLPFE